VIQHVGRDQPLQDQPITVVQPEEAEQEPLRGVGRGLRIEDQNALAIRLRTPWYGTAFAVASGAARSLRFHPGAHRGLHGNGGRIRRRGDFSQGRFAVSVRRRFTRFFTKGTV